jgi:hypothetical protein
MIIAKKQTDPDRYAFDWRHFDSARAGFAQALRAEKRPGRKILIPAYIGYSSREGSGVFDPIRTTGTPYDFYRLDAGLNIRMEDLRRKIQKNRGGMLLLIHYFGFKDRNLDAVKQHARRHGLTIIEDFAHAFFTFRADPVVDFDHAFFSIHKLFPVDSGGLLLSRKPLRRHGAKDPARPDLFIYDLPRIAAKRVENYTHLARAIRGRARANGITLLRPSLGDAVPQTFPILLKDPRLRDRLYFEMNQSGFGVVSLYHTLIDRIGPTFDVEHDIASRILNLPVHQDADKKDIDRMVAALFAIKRDFDRQERK